VAGRWLLCLLLIVGAAHADDKRFRVYDGRIVISPDPVPTTSDELLRYLDSNATKDGHYELIKGPPWEIHLVGLLAKDPGSKPVTLVFVDTADKKATPLQSIDVRAKKQLVIANTSATTAAGFEANKTYAVQLVVGGKPLAKAELLLRH
jgi:hypothetical protein